MTKSYINKFYLHYLMVKSYVDNGLWDDFGGKKRFERW